MTSIPAGEHMADDEVVGIDSGATPPQEQAALSEEQELREALEQLGLGHRAETLAPALLRASEDPVRSSQPAGSRADAAVRSSEEEEEEDDENDDDDDEEDATTLTTQPFFAAAAAQQQPARQPMGELTASGALDTARLVSELQRALGSHEHNVKRLLVQPTDKSCKVHCDIVRTGNTYRCYLLLEGRQDRRGAISLRQAAFALGIPVPCHTSADFTHSSTPSAPVCILEALRKRKGRLYNPEYRITLPEQMFPAVNTPAEDTSRRAELYCGRMRSYHLSGADFVAYDDGVKPGRMREDGGGAPQNMRRQMVAMCFQKSSAQHSVVRMLVPAPSHIPEAANAPPEDLVDALRSIPSEAGHEVPPAYTNYLKLVPPRWNEDEGVFEGVFAGRAHCASNKNVQLVDVSRPDEAAVVVGKLQPNEFSLDFGGCISPFQAFAAALAIFDVSSVRRRF